MGDLVVVGVVHVDDRGAPDHLLDDERGAQRPERDVRRGTHRGVRESAMHPGHDPGASLPSRLDVLLDHLRQVADDHRDVVVGTDEEPAEGRAVTQAALLDLDGGHHQEGAIRVAREDVADARATGGEEAFAIRDALLDDRRILGVVGDQELTGLLLPPPEVGDAVVVAVEDARLARGSGRGQQGVPVSQSMRAITDPAGHGRHAAGPQRVADHVVGEAVELDDDDARGIGPDHVRVVAGEGPRERPVVGVVLVETEQEADGAGDAAEHERDDEGAHDAGGDRHGGHERIEQQDDDGLEDERQDDESDDRPVRDDGQERRSDEEIEQRDEQHRDETAAELRDLEHPRQQPGGDVEGDDPRDEGDEGTLQECRPAEAPVPQQRDLRLVEATQSPDHAQRSLSVGLSGRGASPRVAGAQVGHAQDS